MNDFIHDPDGCFNDLCECGHNREDHVSPPMACALCECKKFVE